MRITAPKDRLLQGIQAVQNAVSNRGSLPILANILLEAKDGKLVLTATDLDLAISCEVAAEVSEAGAITVPAKRFGDIIKEIRTEDAVQLESKKGDTLRIDVHKTYFKLPGLPKDDFPQIPNFTKEKDPISLSQKNIGIYVADDAIRDESR